MQQLIIHIGAKKTGSTTLQAALKSNIDLLASNGVYVSRVCGRREDYLASKPYVSCYEYARRDALMEWFEGAKRFMEKGPARSVLTAESFSDMYRDEIHDFRKDIPNIFDSVKIILYVRRQDLSAVSHYSTALRGGGYSKMLMSKRIGRRGRRPLSYGSVASDWAEAFGEKNVIVRRYVEEYAGHWDIVSDFFGILDFAFSPELLGYTSENRSLGLIEAACLRKYNEMVATGRLDSCQESKKTVLAKASLHKDNNNRIPRPKKQYAYNFFRAFDDENRRLKERFFPSSSILFDSNFEMYPDAQCDIDTFVPAYILSDGLT